MKILSNHQTIETVRSTSGIPTIGGDLVTRGPGPNINFPNPGLDAHHPLELIIMNCHSSLFAYLINDQPSIHHHEP